MALQLRVVGAQAARLGDRYTRVFGIHGGQIGRAPDNDWVLPDEERYVSGYHASVALHRGRWVLTDRSSNGTYVNGAPKPLPTHTTYPLKDGDRLRIGDYEIAVRITPEADFPPNEHLPAVDDSHNGAFATMTHGDIGAELDLPSLLADATPPPDDEAEPLPFPAPNDENPALRAEGTLTAADVARLLSAPDDPPASAGAETPPPASAAPSVPVVAVAASPVAASAPAASRAAEGNGPAGLKAAAELLLRSAGLDPSAIAGEDPAHVLSVAGQLLREMTLGLGAAVRASSDVPNSLATTAIRSVNPLAMADGVNDSLARLLTRRTQRHSGPVDTVRDGFGELRRHEQALHQATREALEEYLGMFAPGALTEQFDRVLERSATPGVSPRARYWDMYGDLYRVLVQPSETGLPHAFAERYTRAYQSARENDDPNQATASRRIGAR